ncbi:ParB/RepB/Spo0J family partition protein [Deinococcus sp. Leaf326]|uniref:ParB/RepB/Spo0J family partition protein n=1 Tax=Deinococcus sp. Leaf326 TaxID=1736338 RepID=UPI0006F5F5E3|nr:ParB/RepB/Spo0J family partition protein [Deinococcus sp. Leaf326]KQR18868.1 chromosome partitioning protein ParB [Deinococcus sp. Leaf326]
MTRKRPPRREGLAELLGGASALAHSPELTLQVADLRPGAAQPRQYFDEVALESLAQSIRTEGVLQPLLVRPVPDGYEIVAGERRWRAAQLAGLEEVPVIIRDLDERQARVAALMENLQRENLSLIDEVTAKLDLVASVLGLSRDEARGRLMQLLREEPSEDHQQLEQVFSSLGEQWGSYAKNKLHILNWPAPLLDALRSGLPRTLASVIVGAPEEHHAELIALAQGGASRAELMTAVDQLREKQRAPVEPSTSLAVRRLTSRRFMGALPDDEKKAVERWLARMPEVLRRQE